MIKVARALHFLGLAMFLGSVLAHITVGFIPGADSDPRTMLTARQAVSAATVFVTVPGLALLLATGVFLTVRSKMGVGRTRWLTVHQVLGVLIVLNGVFVLYPLGSGLSAAATQLVEGTWSLARFDAVAARERIFGSVNVILALVTVLVAVLKPRLGAAKR